MNKHDRNPNQPELWALDEIPTVSVPAPTSAPRRLPAVVPPMPPAPTPPAPSREIIIGNPTKPKGKAVFVVGESEIKEAPLVEAAPGQWIPKLDSSMIKKFAFVELKTESDGSMVYKPRKFPSRARIAVAAEASGLSVQTIVRLGLNIDPVTSKPFIKLTHPTPSTRMVDLHSLVQHLNAADEDFWTEARRKAFNKSVY